MLSTLFWCCLIPPPQHAAHRPVSRRCLHSNSLCVVSRFVLFVIHRVSVIGIFFGVGVCSCPGEHNLRRLPENVSVQRTSDSPHPTAVNASGNHGQLQIHGDLTVCVCFLWCASFVGVPSFHVSVRLESWCCSAIISLTMSIILCLMITDVHNPCGCWIPHRVPGRLHYAEQLDAYIYEDIRISGNTVIF